YLLRGRSGARRSLQQSRGDPQDPSRHQRVPEPERIRPLQRAPRDQVPAALPRRQRAQPERGAAHPGRQRRMRHRPDPARTMRRIALTLELRVAGVKRGTITALDVTPQKTALVSFEVGGGFPEFKADASCSSEPQSLIAEYFLNCDPGHSPEPLDGPIPAAQNKTTVQP